MLADIIVDLQYGDCGKGKVTHHLCKNGDYTHVIRYNGGCNAGHTIFHEGKKFITHHIPAGVFFGIKSIIGPGCVINPDKFFDEIAELERGGIKTEGLICVAKNAHVITDEHLEEDGKDSKIGTTKKGNGPAYRDKYARKGLRAEDLPCFEEYLVDIYEELHIENNAIALLEGAQGFGLDIDWGDYPYVTSSHCTAASALLNGIPPQAVRKVWGVAKVYETYVGAKAFEPKDEIFKMLRLVGKEYGATTGRPRQCNWMNWNLLEKAANINGVTDLVFNKVDVLREIQKWNILNNKEKIQFDSEEGMKTWILDKLANFPTNPTVYFSESPNYI